MNLHGGASRKLGLRGEDGVNKYNWPISVLSVDWVRERWGGGAYQANWIVEDEGKLVPRGRSRVVELDDVAGPRARARAAAPASIAFVNGAAASSPPPPAPAMPQEVVDMRVQAAQEIANLRIKTQEELFRQQMDWQRQMAEERYTRLEERLEQRIDDISRRRGRDDDDDEPGEWEWLKELAQKMAPTLEVLVPEMLKRFAGPKGLPG